MIVALLVARLALAGVFVVAGAAKLANLPAARGGAVGLGLRRSAVGVGVPALAGFEVLVGAGLVPAWSSRYPAAAGAVAVLALTAVAGQAIRRGRRAVCGCFGSLGSGLIGRASLIRNAVIVAVSALVAAAGSGGSRRCRPAGRPGACKRDHRIGLARAAGRRHSRTGAFERAVAGRARCRHRPARPRGGRPGTDRSASGQLSRCCQSSGRR